jgi:hypothetical protein
MKKYDDDSLSEKEWSIKKIIKTYYKTYLKINGSESFAINDLNILGLMEKELRRRKYKIIERIPLIKKILQ